MAASLNLDIALLFGFFGGVVSFFKGFRVYREARLLQDTPEMPIRSIAMGLVRIHGKAKSEHPVSSPISHTPCCFYVVRIEKWRDEGEKGTWAHYGTEADGVRFYLEDSSGRVLVDARGAEYDIEMTLVRDVPSMAAPSFAARGASDTELLGYVARVGPSPEPPGPQHMLELERMVATFKSLKKQKNPEEFLQAMGQMEQLREALRAQGPLSDPLSGDLRFGKTELYEHPPWSREYMEGENRSLGLEAQGQEREGSGHEPPSQPIPPTSEAAAPAGDVPAADLVFAESPSKPMPPTSEVAAPATDAPPAYLPFIHTSLASDRYRFVERCILPDHEYDITGTCAENIEAKDANDHNLIKKGINEPTYLISGLARSDVNAMMQKGSYLLIFGGGVLAVVCLWLLLFRFGLF